MFWRCLEMAKLIKPLTVTEVKNAKPEDSPLRDGGGLLLDISPVSKRWRFDYRKPFSGKRTDKAFLASAVLAPEIATAFEIVSVTLATCRWLMPSSFAF